MKLTPAEQKNFSIAPSRNGQGIFTKRPFVKDETLFEVRGAFVSGDEGDEMDEETRNNTYRYDADSYISPQGTLGDMLNHSCSPNAKVVKKGKKLFIVAIKNIPAHKELFIDYSTIIASDDSWRMKCNCGTKVCRKKIGKYKNLPAQLQKKYQKRGMVPIHIL